MAVQKIVISMTVLCDTDTLQEATDAYCAMSLSQIHDAITDGDDIGGGMKLVSAETLTDRERIVEELLAVGNDGTFFDCNDGFGEFADAAAVAPAA